MQPALKQTQKLPYCPLPPAIPGEERTALRPGPSAAWTANPVPTFVVQEDDRDKPLATADNEPVYTDSCLEAFLACYPHGNRRNSQLLR